MTDKLKSYYDFIKRHAAYFIAGIIAALLFGVADVELKTLFLCVVFESVALMLSGLALYSYTALNFTEELLKGKDDKYNADERKTAIQFAGMIFIGVHFLVGAVVFGSYIVLFAE